MSNKLHWSTISKKVSDLIPQDINPRKISDKQMSDLKRSLNKFGLAEIPAIDTDGKILAGHQRIKALVLLGRADEIIDVRVPSRKLTEDEAKEYLIGSNALGGDWDYDLLKSFEISTLTVSGFDEIKLAKVFDTEKDMQDDGFDTNKELKKIKNPSTKKGDLIIMGEHRLLCASSTDINAVRKLFGANKAEAIYSDPPFNIGLSYDKGVGNKRSYGGSTDDDKPTDEYVEFIRQVMKSALAVSADDVHVAFWADEAWVWVFQTLYIELGIKNRRLNIWLKNNASPVPTVAFNKCAEFCVYGTKGIPFLSPLYQNLNEVQNKELGTGNQLLEDVSNIWATKRLPSNKMEHPTSKNPELHYKFIMRCTKPGGIIYDAFSGSASTMICAEQLGRKVYSLEIEPVFCDLAIKRYEKLTGRKAEVIHDYYHEEK
jgi:DNA modification methylase